ncbi:MAG: DUF4147 domain-containing protein [Acidimicrobiia bacterium]|nr:DUF4147 domain-containing protein [Acidimicrobiia bacterium]
MDNVAARRLLADCFRAGVAAADPEAAVADALEPMAERVVVLALGKAAPAMARGAAHGLGRDRLEGIVVSNHADDVPAGLELIVSSHPIPDERSIDAGRSLLALAEGLTDADVALVLVSGGGSALADVPVPGVSLADLTVVNDVLLRSGADITATNTVRRRLSLFKGGGLAAAIHPARAITLAVSDVVGDAPEAIASGPTVDPRDEPSAALHVVRRLDVEDQLPESVLRTLTAPPPQRGPVAPNEYRIVAGAARAAHAAAVAAESAGVPATVVDTRLTGDVPTAAGDVLTRAGWGLSVFAGETTVDVVGDGVGGRNHEAALIVATLIAGRPGIWFLAAGTDGIDGTTDAAGSVVDGETVTRAISAGLDPDLALERNDSGGFFAELGERIVPGPTGTNVGDLWFVLRI